MRQISDYLEQLGLSDIETKIYLSLLKSGPVSVRDVAKATGINRTTTYLHIDQLVEKGLIIKLVKGAQKLIAANQAQECLQELVNKKIAEAKLAQQELPKVLTAITNSIPNKSAENSELKFLKGKNALKKIYEEAFNAAEFRSYVRVEDAPVLSSDNPTFFSSAFKNNKKLKVWEIMYDSPASRRQAFKTLSLTNNYYYKFMPPELKWSLTSEDILMYDGKVVIVNYKDDISIVVLQSADYYNNSKEIFDFIWKILPEPETDN